MKRSSLFVCCGITLLYLSPGSNTRTVSPIVYLTTVAPTGYYSGDSQTGYYGSASGKSEYYGGQPRNNGVGPTIRYGRGPAAAATGYGSYGHRSVPESAIRPVRDDRSYALYESPNTYEYMQNPPRKSGKVSRVPETERLPPGDDVEFIDGGGQESRDYDGRPQGHHHQQQHNNNHNHNGKRTTMNKPKGRKPSPVREDADYANDGETGGGGDAEQVVSSSAKKPRRGEATGRKNEGDTVAPVKHKIHKKNEYSKRQQFFDEEHVDHGKKKKPIVKAKRDGGGGGGGGGGRKTTVRSEPRKRPKKERQQPRRPVEKSVQKPVVKRVKKDDRGTSSRAVQQVTRQGYGQVVALR